MRVIGIRPLARSQRAGPLRDVEVDRSVERGEPHEALRREPHLLTEAVQLQRVQDAHARQTMSTP
jgi:hypothetical protein